MYKQFDPPEDLKPFVCYFYEMEYSDWEFPKQPILPSGTEIMGWQYAGRWRMQMPESANGVGSGNELPPYYTLGQQVTTYHLTALDHQTGMMGVALRPGALWQYFRKPSCRFTQRTMDTRQLFAYHSLHPILQRYEQDTDTDERLAILVDFYRRLYERMDWEGSLVDQALAEIYRTKGCTSVCRICDQLHIHERYLQRHFKQRIGVTVQQYIGIMRFNNVFAALNLEREGQSMELIALLHNYYDQSHFNKEYKKYFGVAPSDFELDKFLWLKELIDNTPYNLTVQESYLEGVN